MNQKLKFALGRVENIVGKVENAGYQGFRGKELIENGFITTLLEKETCGKPACSFLQKKKVSTFSKTSYIFIAKFDLSAAKALGLYMFKIVLFGNDYRLHPLFLYSFSEI